MKTGWGRQPVRQLFAGCSPLSPVLLAFYFSPEFSRSNIATFILIIKILFFIKCFIKGYYRYKTSFHLLLFSNMLGWFVIAKPWIGIPPMKTNLSTIFQPLKTLDPFVFDFFTLGTSVLQMSRNLICQFLLTFKYGCPSLFAVSRTRKQGKTANIEGNLYVICHQMFEK